MSQSKLMSFFSSATKKRKRDSDDSDESQPGPSTPKKTSRPRGFCDDWLVKYDWLYLENGKMKCHPCVNTRQNNPFSGSGCTNFRNSTLVRHQKTSAHTDALKGLKLQSDMKKSTGFQVGPTFPIFPTFPYFFDLFLLFPTFS